MGIRILSSKLIRYPLADLKKVILQDLRFCSGQLADSRLIPLAVNIATISESISIRADMQYYVYSYLNMQQMQLQV